MSFTAYIAFRNESTQDTYDIHYSNNGGDNYVLKQILEDYIDNEVSRTANEHPKARKIDSLTKYIVEDSQWADQNQIEDVDMISPDPIAVNISKENILDHIPSLETETLYIVNDNTVKTYIPITPSPEPIYKIHQSAEIDLYKLKEGETGEEMYHNKGRDPDVTLTRSDFSPENIYHHPEWVMKTIEQAHRYFANSIDKLGQQNHAQTTPTEMIYLPRITAMVRPTGTIPKSKYTPLTIPVQVFFDKNNTPSYKMVRSSIKQMGTEPKSYASTQRLLGYKAFYEELNNHDDLTRVVEKHSNKTANKFLTKYHSSIDSSLIPDKKLKTVEQPDK